MENLEKKLKIVSGEDAPRLFLRGPVFRDWSRLSKTRFWHLATAPGLAKCTQRIIIYFCISTKAFHLDQSWKCAWSSPYWWCLVRRPSCSDAQKSELLAWIVPMSRTFIFILKHSFSVTFIFDRLGGPIFPLGRGPPSCYVFPVRIDNARRRALDRRTPRFRCAHQYTISSFVQRQLAHPQSCACQAICYSQDVSIRTSRGAVSLAFSH